MKINKYLVFYIISIGLFILLMWIFLDAGKVLEHRLTNPIVVVQGENVSANTGGTGIWQELSSHLAKGIQGHFGILLLQIIVIIFLSRILGYLFHKLHQPIVIGEIIAGILLGPSFLGNFFPGTFHILFPPESLNNLNHLSQIGLILFMFIIGMELDLKMLKRSAGTAVLVSHVSIILPYILGVILSYFIYSQYAPHNISFLAFALFMGIAMSITAFPILARIIQEKGLSHTPLGVMALSCGAIDDVTAWSLLAVVITIVKSGTATAALTTLALSIGYIIFMLFVLQPFLKKIARVYSSKENLSKNIIAIIFLILLLSSLTTEAIGIHALFGAFIAGIIMPHNLEFKKNFVEKIEDISLVLLLPLFFAYSGLHTQINLLTSGSLWIILGVVIAFAVIGKFVGSSFAARFGGLSWEHSLYLGILMNTRGLIELIVLSIGYELGILTPEIFTITVLMALVTTFMTGPGMQIVSKIYSRKRPVLSESAIQAFKVLISFGPPQMGSTLLNLANLLSPDVKDKNFRQYTAIHLTPSSEVHPAHAEIYEREGFEPILKTSRHIGVNLHTIYKATEDVQSEILKTVNRGNFDLLLMGSAKSVFSEDHLGGKVKKLLLESRCNVGILIDRHSQSISNVLMILDQVTPVFIEQLLTNLLLNEAINNLTISSDVIDQIPSVYYEKTNLLQQNKINQKSLKQILSQGNLSSTFDLVILSLNTWKELVSLRVLNIETLPSVLILKPKS